MANPSHPENMDHLLQQLESCASIMMAPPSTVTPDQLNSAQQVFVEFQRMKQPFELCRKLLEGPHSPYVKFQAASCLKSGVIRDWNFLRGEGQRALHLLHYLLQYVTSNPGLEAFVREQLLLVSAILLKRIGIEETSGATHVRLSELKVEQDTPSIVRNVMHSMMNMLSSSASAGSDPLADRVHRMFVAVSFLQAVLHEYSSSTRASDFGLPWIKHLDAKKRFELTYLRDVFTLTLESLNKVISGSEDLVHRLKVQRQRDMTDLLMRLLQLLESMFTWNFEIITIISSQYAIQVDSIETPIFQPPIEWRDTLVNDSVTQFLFFLYHEVRSLGQDSLTHHSLQCLSQLSSLTGCVLVDPRVSLRFVQSLMTGVISFMTHGLESGVESDAIRDLDLQSCEVTPVSLILYRICLHLQDRDTLKLIDKNTSRDFVLLFTRMTCSFLKSCMKCERDDPEDWDRYKQAIENVSDGWSVTLQALGKHMDGVNNCTSPLSLTPGRNSYKDLCDGLDLVRQQEAGMRDTAGDPATQLLDPQLLQSCAKQVFETYIKCHISRPEGLKDVESQAADQEEEIAEYEEEDGVLYFDQLNAVGSIGRVDLMHSLTLLSRLLVLRISQMQQQMERMATSGKSSVPSHEWSAVNEDVHWLIMIATWTLSQSSWFSDRDLIPDEVMRLSIRFSADVNQSVQFLQSAQSGLLSLSSTAHLESVDPVVLVIGVILHLCRMEQQVIENNMQLFSPQVSSTISSFVSRFMTGFLMPNESDYKEISMTLVSCFGRDSGSAAEVLHFLVSHLLSKLFSWSSEPSLKEGSAETLVSFVSNSSERCRVILSSDRLVDRLFSLSSHPQLNSLPANARRTVFSLLVLLSSHRVCLFERIFQPLLQSYALLKAQVTSPGAKSEALGTSVIEFMDCLIGMSEATSPTNVSHVWSSFLGGFYANEVSLLLDSFHSSPSVVVAILDLVSSLANRVLCFLQSEESLSFYRATIDVFSVYARHNRGRVTTEAGAEEETVQDILLLIQILNHLASKDWIDWFPVSSTSQVSADRTADDETPVVTASQVIFLGLEIMMPLLNRQLLEYQKLSQSYYKLMVLVCDEVDHLVTVSQSLRESIFASIELALQSNLPSDVKCNCLILIESVAKKVSLDRQKYACIQQLMQSFLSLLLQLALTECGSSKDVTLRENVANAIYAMIHLFPHSYQQLMQQVIQSQVHLRSDPSLAPALQSTFDALVADMNLAPESDVPKSGFWRSRTHAQGVRAFRQRFDAFVTEVIGLLRIK